MLGNFASFFAIFRFFLNSSKSTIRISNHLDPIQSGYLVGPDLGQNCLQRLISRIWDLCMVGRTGGNL